MSSLRPTSQRIDKWLWVARFFKTRGLAAACVNGGGVQVDGERVKPAKRIRVGSVVQVRRGADLWTITLLGIGERRGPASEAAALYEERPESRAARERTREARARAAQARDRRAGRPTKRDRRQLMALKASDEPE